MNCLFLSSPSTSEKRNGSSFFSGPSTPLRAPPSTPLRAPPSTPLRAPPSAPLWDRLVSGAEPRLVSGVEPRSNLASIATNIAHRIIPAAINPSPRKAGRAVSANEYISPGAFAATSLGDITRAKAVPSLAIASCSPIAKAIGPSLNHLAIERVTATPAISLPRPNSMQPT